MNPWRSDKPPYYLSAYALACRKGFKGTLDEWLESLTAYGEAVKHGFEGTKEEWLQSLTAYGLAKKEGFTGSIIEWIASLKGDKGDTGKSAYQYALEGGFVGSEELFREQQAHSGKSAYEYAVDGGYTGTVEDFYRKLATEYIAASGGIMTGNLSMGGHKISELAEPEDDWDVVTKGYADNKLPKSGGTMTGDIAMGGNKVTGLGAPTEDTDAVTKGYADNKLPKSGGAMTGSIAMDGNKVTGLGTPSDSGDAATKGYVDGKHFLVTVALPAAGWAGDAAPYTQTVAAPGMLETDTPHYGVVYSGTAEEKGLQKDGFALVDDLDTGAGSVTFTCFEEAPEVDLTIQLEVNR